jgi:hypothetical protein
MSGNNIGNRPRPASTLPRPANTTPGRPHHPNAPAHEGARSLDAGKEASSKPKTHRENKNAEAPEGHALKRRDEGLVPKQHRLNSPQVMASNNFPDVKPNGHIDGTVVNATQVAGHGSPAASLSGVDWSALPSYRNDMTERRGTSPDSYKGAAGTKAEKADEKRSYIHEFKNNTGDPGHNNVVLNERKKAYAYVNENQGGKVAREGAGELAYTSAAVRVEDSHEGRLGRTEWKAAAEGPAAKLAGEYELRASKKEGEQALAAHLKGEASVSAYNVSGTVDHKFNKNLAVGAHAFSQASAFSSNEASLVVDRQNGTYMGKLTSANIAGIQGGAGVSAKVGPFQADITAAKLGGVGYVFNAGGGLHRGVASGVLDLGGALGPGGRLRVGGSVDTVEMKDSLRNGHNRMTNPNYSQQVRDYSKGSTIEERAQFQRQKDTENEIFNAAWKARPAPQLNTQIPESSLGIDFSKKAE